MGQRRLFAQIVAVSRVTELCTVAIPVPLAIRAWSANLYTEQYEARPADEALRRNLALAVGVHDPSHR